MKREILAKLYQEIIKVMPMASSDIVVVNKGKVLLLRRTTNPLNGYWGLPGGGINLGETPKQAAVRELKEETGLVVSQDDLLGEKVFTHFNPGRQNISVTYAIRIKEAGIVLNSEHDKYTWASCVDGLPEPISSNAVEQINWALTNKEVIG